ncbi:MAG: sugar phosphate isomerase/epimerase family protein [Bacillota bacterium]|jgi:sugar phosphate isomerase/epimerase|nr:TIM barrel protein [Candidatus Fermentithermobacillaceae bacterium]
MKGLLGVVHYALFPESCSGDWDLTGSLDVVLQDNAFGAIELTWIKDGTIRRKAAEKLRVSGLQVMFSGGPAFSGSGFSLCSVDESDRLQAVAFANYLVDMACELGGRNLLVPSGPDPGEESRSPALDALRRSLIEICRYSRECRPENPVVVTLEPFDRDVDCRQLVGSTRLARDVVARVRERYQNCGITLDMSHVAQLGEDMAQAIHDAGDCLSHAHIANCVLDPKSPLYGDKHPPFGVPGGVYSLDDAVRYIDLLERSGFFSRPCPYGQPVVSLEVRPGNLDPVEVLEEFKGRVYSRNPGRGPGLG